MGPQVQGKSWAKLVQGQRCGRLVQSDSPSEESPAELCRSNLVRCCTPIHAHTFALCNIVRRLLWHELT